MRVASRLAGAGLRARGSVGTSPRFFGKLTITSWVASGAVTEFFSANVSTASAGYGAFDPSALTDYESSGSYGHGGPLGTNAWVDPNRQLIRIFLISRAPNKPEDVIGEERHAFMTMAAAAIREWSMQVAR